MKIERLPLRVALLVAPLALAACGGGGGDSPPASSAVNIDISAANRDNLAHASAAAVLTSSPSSAVPLASSAQGGPAQGLAAGGAWPQRLRSALLQGTGAGPTREQALAISATQIAPCAVSGTVTLSFEDRDGNNAVSAGDVLTMAFNQCVDTAGTSVNGSASATYTQVITTPTPAVKARMALTQMSTVTANHALTLHGVMLLDYAQPSALLETTRLTAEGLVTVSFNTHLPHSDTVTLQSGYTQFDSYDPTALPPGGGVAGRTSTTLQGRLQSVQAGGIVEVATAANAPLVSYDADSLGYPREGVLQVKGVHGTLRMSALSASTVQLELDADDNGTYETAGPVGWDWLL